MEKIEGPVCHEDGSDLLFTWDPTAIEVRVADIRPSRDGPRAEVYVRERVNGDYLYAGMVNLLSSSSRETFRKALLPRAPGLPWDDIALQFAMIATEKWRKGSPLELAQPTRKPEAGQYAVESLAPVGLPSLWYGDGKSNKSYLLEACFRAMVNGGEVGGLQIPKLNPAFLDWEWDKQEYEDRLMRLGGDTVGFYRRMDVPLHEQVKYLKRDLDKHNIDTLGVDSLGLAAGGDPSDPEVALRLFGAIRTLGRTTIIIHHVPKEGKDPYGSAYIRNSARSGWLFLKSSLPEEGTSTIAIRHRWTNVGPNLSPIGLQFRFDESAYTTTIHRTNPKNVPELVEGMSIKGQIVEHLKGTAGLTIDRLATLCDVSKEKVSVHLSQLKKQGRVANPSTGQWTLVSSRTET